jgi:hypothetical protein
MKPIDRDAMRRAIAEARKESPGRQRQIDGMLAERPWEEVGRFAAQCCQSRNLGLKPWQPRPVSAEVYPCVDRFPTDGRRAAHELLQRLLAAGVSRYEPSPLDALRKATAKASPATAAST